MTVSLSFLDKIVRKTPSGFRKYYAKLHFKGGSSEPEKLSKADLVRRIQSDSSAIGFIDKADVTDDLKVVYEF